MVAFQAELVKLANDLLSLSLAETLDSSSGGEGSWGGWGVSTASGGLLALHAGPNANNGPLDGGLAAEWAWVLLPL